MSVIFTRITKVALVKVLNIRAIAKSGVEPYLQVIDTMDPGEFFKIKYEDLREKKNKEGFDFGLFIPEGEALVSKNKEKAVEVIEKNFKRVLNKTPIIDDEKFFIEYRLKALLNGQGNGNKD